MSVIPERTLAVRYSDKDKAKLFRKVIELAQDPDLSYGEIATQLNKLGHRMLNGKKCDAKFVNNTVAAIRRREADGTLTSFLKEN